MKSVLDIFAERLKELMGENHLNIKELSEKIGIPRSTINSWTLKRKIPKIDNLYIVCMFFNVSSNYLIGIENERY